MTWQWTQVGGSRSNTAVNGGVTLKDATSATASFTAPTEATVLYFRLIVTPPMPPYGFPQSSFYQTSNVAASAPDSGQTHLNSIDINELI